MDRDQMVRALKSHIRNNYETQNDAAAAWGTSAAVLSRVLHHKILPTEQMLNDIGLVMVKPEVTYRKVRKEKK
jgi:hypothetical protein